MKRIVMFVISLCMLGHAAAQNGIFPYKVHKKTLANDLKVFVIPMSSPGLVSFYSIVRTGSRDEYEPGYTGFAHFFEHMMFRGTKNYPGSVYDRMMTEMGANINAYTTDDYTCYHVDFSKEDLQTILTLESDRFQNLDYTEQAFKTEAGAVHGEYLKSLSSPWMLLNENILATAFDQHTYRHTVIGFRKDIEAMPGMYEYSKKFYNRYYRPENVVLLATGDIDPQHFYTEVEKYYGNWQKGYIAPKIPVEPEQKKGRKVNITFKGRTLPIVVLAYKGIAFDPDNIDLAACDLFCDLAFGETSDIYKKLVINEQRVQFIRAEVSSNRDPALNEIYTMIKNPDDIEAVVQEIEETLVKFTNEPVSENDLEKLASHNKYAFLMNLDTPSQVAGRLARFIALTGDVDAVDRYYATLENVTPENIQSAVKRYFTDTQRTVAVLKGGM
ncbi:insulinase family protein [candidate division KSB1 bacterium]|nr:insulinase family protein [candidate division KSB1 bacterium]